jgi:esterase/lipase superfamily enzyme
LAQLKRLELILAIGRDDPMRGENEEFSRRLWAKGLWHALRIWDGWSHDWPYWRDMIRVYAFGAD